MHDCYIRQMKVLLVDDHPLLREGVASVLQRADAATVVVQAVNGQEGLDRLAEQDDIALVLMDLRMATMPGLETLEQIRRRYPDVPAMVLSSSEDPADVRRALKAGARGYCPKSSGSGTLLAALRLVLDGEVYVPPFMAQAPDEESAPPDASGLTPRQKEVLQALCSGKSNKEIANALGMQEKTVKGHVSVIFRTLKVVHRLQAVEVARASGIVGAPGAAD
jgi:two-component system nitrate/nitrite response regulator NarL